MSRIVGYVRVSTTDQNIHRQIDEMEKRGVHRRNIYCDKESGYSFERPSYQKMMRSLKKGDLIFIKSIDRLGRNYKEVIEQWQIITKKKGIDIRVLDMPLLDTTIAKDLLGTFISDLVLQLLSFVAENERAMIRARQAEGIKAAKTRGVKFGRPRRKKPEQFEGIYQQWRLGKITQRKAAQLLELPVSTFSVMAKREEQREPNL